MSVITAIQPSARHAGRFDLVVDGHPEATVSLDMIERLELRVGLPYAPLQEAVAEEAAVLATYDRALNMLAFRGRSASELRRSLVRKGEERARVDVAVERLREAGLLDDASFARQFARSKVLGAGHSRRRLQQELARKGVARDTADEAIGDVMEQEAVDEVALVEAAARKKLRSLAKLDPVIRDRRLWAYLARRGHDSTSIREVMGRLAKELDAGEE